MPPLSDVHDNSVFDSSFQESTTSVALHDEVNQSRSVSFSPFVAVREIPHYIFYSAEEAENLWLQQADHQRIREEFALTVEMIVSQQLIEDNDERCFRGAEFGVPAIADRRLREKDEALWTVLLEHESQKDQGLSDPDMLRLVYQRFSEHSLANAQMQAFKDAEDIKDYLGQVQISMSQPRSTVTLFCANQKCKQGGKRSLQESSRLQQLISFYENETEKRRSLSISYSVTKRRVMQ